MRRLSLCIILTASVLAASAQVSVEAVIDSIQIFVGQQVHVTLTATAKENAKVEFPQFKPMEYITPGVEVLDRQELEQQAQDNGFVSRSMVYTMTSFDDTLYYIPPMTVKIDGKPYKSKSLALKVLTIEVDTLHAEQFFGPKDVQDNPFLWSDWEWPFWLSVLMLVLLAVAYYLYLRLRDNKPIISHIRIVKRLLPHQKAMKEIEQIKANKMVSSENSKEYYTKLTDTLRKYIEERYGFNAMEMTSSEIIEKLMASQDQKALDELRQLFTTADLVKFAKYSTLINENDANLVNAIDFINQTKLENVPVEETVKPQLSEEDQRSQKTRRVLKYFITAIAVVCLALFGYVVYTLYMLLG
ncbi:MAG: BatD family protein [Prevotella sp.]|nr:BatD family protein [Prevotella sp.]